MSAGNQVKTLRVYPLLSYAIDETIKRRNVWTRKRPWSWSEFMIIAAWEKIAKMKRSRTRRPSLKNTLENTNAI